MSGVDHSTFRSAMAQVPGPVTVVATADPASGQRWGFTASSFTSLSMVPPLVLVCLARSAGSHQAFVRARAFLISVLAAGQEEVAQRFAAPGPDKFAAGDLVPCELGLPGLPGAVARLACVRHAVLDGGDHSILVGRVEQAFGRSDPPLLYHRRAFSRPEPLAAPVGLG